MRISWVSKKAEHMWEPRLNRIINSLREIQLVAVIKGILPFCIMKPQDRALLALEDWWKKIGLQSIQITSGDLQCQLNDKSDEAYILVGLHERIHSLSNALAQGDGEETGRQLGIPDCCRNFMNQIYTSKSHPDPTWAIACNTVHPDELTATVSLSNKYSINILWRSLGISCIQFFPCQFDCEHSSSIGEAILQNGIDEGYGKDIRLIKEVLSWPVEWSSLHGITEVKTPILKFIEESNPVAQKHTIRWESDSYPAEGARGTSFPYIPYIYQTRH